MLRVKGVASLIETITLVEGLPERVLQAVDGERRLTDLRHVGQLLHAAATTEQLGATALTVVAAPADRRGRRGHERRGAQPPPGVRRRGGPGPDDPSQQGPRVPDRLLPVPVGARLDPATSPSRSSSTTPTRTTSASSTSGWTAPTSPRHRRQHEVEQRGEDLRLAYVALTRAQHQAVVWWAGSWDSRDSPLGRLLFARDADGNVAAGGRRDPEATPRPSHASRRSRRRARLHQRRASRRSACRSRGRASRTAPPELSAARFDRELDWRWRRTSYSDITAGSYEARVASEPEENVVDDEEPREATAGRRRPTTTRPSLLHGAPSLLADDAGRRPGRHASCTACCEATDFAAPDLDAELAAHVAAAHARRRVEIGDPTAVVAGLRAAIETPLGPLLEGDCACATSRAPIASTSWTSSCRSSAATSPPAG